MSSGDKGNEVWLTIKLTRRDVVQIVIFVAIEAGLLLLPYILYSYTEFVSQVIQRTFPVSVVSTSAIEVLKGILGFDTALIAFTGFILATYINGILSREESVRLARSQSSDSTRFNAELRRFRLQRYFTIGSSLVVFILLVLSAFFSFAVLAFIPSTQSNTFVGSGSFFLPLAYSIAGIFGIVASLATPLLLERKSSI